MPIKWLFVGLVLLAAVSAPAGAQTAAPDSSLTTFVGVWAVEVGQTPMGVVTGALVVHEDGTGTLSLVEMGVADTPVMGLTVGDGALVGDVPAFYSPVVGLTFTAAIRLAPAGDGTLAGAIYDNGEPFPMTARRAD
jgi:hypothetical protein